MNGQTETVRLKVCGNEQTTRQIVDAARVQRAAYNQAIEWQVKARKALSVEALEEILNNEKAEGNWRVKHGHADVQHGGLVRASGRFRGWLASPDSKQPDGRIPYESSERAERHGRVRCQAIRGVEITDHGTIQIAGLGELHIIGGVRQRQGATVRELSIQEVSRDARGRPQGLSPEREFVVLMTMNVEQNAGAPAPAPQRGAAGPGPDHNGGPEEHSMDGSEYVGDERQNRWRRRKGRREKQGSGHGAHSAKDRPHNGRGRGKGGSQGWDAEGY